MTDAEREILRELRAMQDELRTLRDLLEPKYADTPIDRVRRYRNGDKTALRGTKC